MTMRRLIQMKQIQNLFFDEEDVKGFEKDPDKDLDDEKNLFVSFDDMDFLCYRSEPSSSEF